MVNLLRNKNIYDYKEVLYKVQEYISKSFPVLVQNEVKQREQIKAYIRKYLKDNKIDVNELSNDELVDKLYTDMAEYGFLTKYLYSNDIEEININSWDDIKITYNSGEIVPCTEKFLSPQNAIDIIRRLLHHSNMILDSSQPIVVGHLSEKIRITALSKGVIDENVGLSVSIRIVNPKKLVKDDFIAQDTLTEEMINFLTLVHRYGESMCLTGATGSGKTTLMSYILSTIPNNKRLFTIENGTREFNLVKRDESGNVINNVIHTVTRHSDDKKQNINMVKLLETGLTVNPDYICVAEMKSSEAFFAQEASRSGHTTTTTIHASSCLATYHKMVTLCKQMYDMDEKLLYKLVTEAFPIVVFCKKLEDNSRKVMEITECYIDSEGDIKIKTLYKFDVQGIKNSKVLGRFKKINNISNQMQKRLLENGMTKDTLSMFLGGKDD